MSASDDSDLRSSSDDSLTTETVPPEAGDDIFDPVDDRADDDTDAGDDNSDAEEVCSPLTVGSARPVKGESFCECYKTGKEKDCKCGEDDSCKSSLLVGI